MNTIYILFTSKTSEQWISTDIVAITQKAQELNLLGKALLAGYSIDEILLQLLNKKDKTHLLAMHICTLLMTAEDASEYYFNHIYDGPESGGRSEFFSLRDAIQYFSII